MMLLSDGQATDRSPAAPPLRRLRTLPARLRKHEEDEEEQKGGGGGGGGESRQMSGGGDSSDYTSLRDIIAKNPNPASRWKLWREAGSGSLNGRRRRWTNLDEQSRNLQLKDELLNTAARAYLLLPQSPIRADPSCDGDLGGGCRRGSRSSSIFEQVRGRVKAFAAFLARLQALSRRLSTWFFLKHKGLLHLLHRDNLPWF